MVQTLLYLIQRCLIFLTFTRVINSIFEYIKLSVIFAIDEATCRQILVLSTRKIRESFYYWASNKIFSKQYVCW